MTIKKNLDNKIACEISLTPSKKRRKTKNRRPITETKI